MNMIIRKFKEDDAEEVSELIPKSVYALYYLTKTGDWKSIPIWAGVEAASFIPYVGDAIDMTNIYINRARDFTKKKLKEDFRKKVVEKDKSDLEKMAA